MARIAIAGFEHETNTFSPFRTTLADYAYSAFAGPRRHGAEVLQLAPGPMPIGGFVAAARRAGHELVPVLYAWAEPSGTLTRETYESIAGEIVAGLRAAGSVDAVFLDLHGAMVAEGVEDGEGELLARVRAALGPGVPIAVSLDLHGNVQRATLAPADVAVAFRTYPHVDMAETGGRCVALLERRLAAGRRPAFAHRPVPFLVPLGRQSTFVEPMRSVYTRLAELEATDPAVWATSLMMGFYLADVPFAGPSAFAYADTQAAAERAVDAIVAELLAAESRLGLELVDADAAARLARDWSEPRPLVLADVQDNSGGGATSDTVDVLRALVEHDVEDAIAGLLFDPESVAAAWDAGTGTDVHLELGGKRMPGQRPLAGTFRVERVREGAIELGGDWAGLRVDLGRTAVVRHGGLRVVVTSGRTQCLSRDYFRVHGLEPVRHRVVVVKSTNHYRADFMPIAGRVLEVASGGCCVMDPGTLTYARLRADVRRRPAAHER